MIGIITPVLKKGKPAKQPNSYRRITITSIVGKIIEKHLLQHIRSKLDPVQSRSQFGFTRGNSPTCAALIITELMAEANASKRELHITFMDTSKALDVVDHKGMLNCMHIQGVQGAAWRLLENMYSDVISCVKWNGGVSMPIKELQGIRQGGDSSADCYKAGKNKLLHHLDSNPSAKIGSINAGSVMVADDLALVSSSAHLMQINLNAAQTDAARERYKFNVTKTKTVTVNCKIAPLLLLNPLGSSPSETHIGITRTVSNTDKETIRKRVKKARQTSYSLMGAGMHGLNGTGPAVAMIQYTTYVLPTLLYGLEALVLDADDIQPLEKFHRKCLRYIQHLPQSSANCALYLLLGALPIEAHIHIKVLNFFRNTIGEEENSPPSEYIRDIVIRQLAMKDDGSSSWVSMVKKLLRTYNLPSAYTLLENTPNKRQWKKTLHGAVWNHWEKEFKEEANTMSTMEFLNVDACQVGKLHPVWKNTVSQLDILKATVKAQLLIKRYPFSTSRTAGKKWSDTCPLCGSEPETTAHFLLRCSKLSNIRQQYLPKVMSCYEQPSPDLLVRVILDSSYISENRITHETLCRNYTYKLHHKRSILLGGCSGYKVNYL